MKYLSTKGTDLVTAREAVLRGLPQDNGLFVPQHIPALEPERIEETLDMRLNEMAYEIISPYLEGEITKDVLGKICNEAFNFPLELIELDHNLFVLELFHGPTLAFKDFGARFMARVMSSFVSGESRELNILVATSGDTGGAVGSGFHNVEGINVTILYPKGKISGRQEAQITTLGGNVTALAVNGTFDDCQKMVKNAFLDEELRKTLFLSSANSINISRLIPQMVYYFGCQSLLRENDLNFVVPSGNLGNISAGVMAHKMGLPAGGFVAAVNSNNTFEHYLSTGIYEPKPSVPTLSNAMDVGDPSNIQRLTKWFEIDDMQSLIHSYSYSDNETRAAILEVLQQFEYDMCPHTAVGYLGARRSMKDIKSPHVVLSTAHPAKFSEEMPDIPYAFEVPQSLIEALGKDSKSIEITANYSNLKDYLLK